MTYDIKRLTVKYNLITVGFLESLSEDVIAFQYDETWVKEGFSISPIHLPLSDEVFISKSPHFGGLFGVFYDSLPGGWGELLMRRMLAKKGINFDKLSALTKLSLVGHNGLGALTYEPSHKYDVDLLHQDLDTLAQEVTRIFNHEDHKMHIDDMFMLGGSSGGARPKVHVTLDDVEWIVKFPSSMDPKNIGTLEYVANQKALKAGIHVNEHKLIPSKICKGYFAAKRFDRNENKRVHVIALSSILETTHKIPNLDYMHLFQVIQKVCVDQEDMYEAYKRMCFNVLYQNKDDHGKNMSFLYDEALGGYRLTPFYDITITPNKLEHEMTVLGNGQPNERDLMDIAITLKLSIKKCQEIIENIKTIINES